jgi:hypothetical protein
MEHEFTLQIKQILAAAFGEAARSSIESAAS